MSDVERCYRCERHLRIVIGVTFNKSDRLDFGGGVQWWCRECKERDRLSPRYGWSLFRRVLVTEGSADKWTEKAYVDLVAANVCHYCGGVLTDWGKGHHVDRISSHRPHVPDNCLPCCAPCNREKNSMNSESWNLALADLLRRYPRGKIPWDERDRKRHKRAAIPDLRPFVVEVQLTIAGSR